MTSEILFPDEMEYLGTKVSIIVNHGKSVTDGKEVTLYRVESMIPVFGKKKKKDEED